LDPPEFGKGLLLEGIEVDKPPVILPPLISSNFLLATSPLPNKLNARLTLNPDVVVAAAVVIVATSFVIEAFVLGKSFLSSKFIFRREFVGVVAKIEEIGFFSLCELFSDDVDVIDIRSLGISVNESDGDMVRREDGAEIE